MSLDSNLQSALTKVGTEFKKDRNAMGVLANLTTAEKSSLVGAINEINARPTGAIDDTAASNSTTYSSNKVNSQISAAVNALIANAPAAYDTLKEISDYIASDQTAAAGFSTALGKRVAVDAAQTFTSGEKAQGRANIDAASATDVGPTNTDYVAVLNAALA